MDYFVYTVHREIPEEGDPKREAIPPGLADNLELVCNVDRPVVDCVQLSDPISQASLQAGLALKTVG